MEARVHALARHGARRLLALLVLAPLLVAGCAERGGPHETTPPTQQTSDPGGRSGGGFAIERLRIVPEDDAPRPLHEDDHAFVRYTIRHAGDAPNATTHLVSLLVDGRVVRVDNLRLEPGESRELEHRLGALRGRDEVAARVKAGAHAASVRADVAEWPRTREDVALGENLTIRVNRWLLDEASGETLVNVTLRQAGAELGLRDLRLAVLCADREGNVTDHGRLRPDLPGPGNATSLDARLSGCDYTIYGLLAKADLPAGGELHQRILFVERGWRPPESP